jgi:hypothetical protein
VRYIGPPENTARCKYKVEFVNRDNTEGVTLMCLTRSADENLRDIYRPDNGWKLCCNVLSRLGYEEGFLYFKVEIIRVGT